MDSSFSPITQISHPYNKAGTATVLCIFQSVIFSNIKQSWFRNTFIITNRKYVWKICKPHFVLQSDQITCLFTWFSNVCRMCNIRIGTPPHYPSASTLNFLISNITFLRCWLTEKGSNMGDMHNSFGNRDTHFKFGSSFGIFIGCAMPNTNKFDQWDRSVFPFV